MNSPLRLTCLTSTTELETVRDEWNAFVLSSQSDIYFDTAWLVSWWEFYGGGRDMRCFMVYDKDLLVAVLPFFTRVLWVGPIPVRHAGLIGADSTIPVFEPAVARGHETAVLAAVLEDLTNNTGCEVISFSPLSGRSALPAALQDPEGISRHYHVAESGQPAPHSVFDLAHSFEAHLAALGSKTRKNYRRELRQLEAKYGEVEVEHTGLEAYVRFDRFAEMHNTQWQAGGNLGHFGDWPDSTAFNRRLIERMSKDQRVRLYVMKDKDGRSLAKEYYFILGERAFWRLGARLMDEEVTKLGIGRVVFLKVLELLMADGVKFVEAGPGHYPYKINLGGEELLLRRLLVCRPTAVARLKLSLLAGWADFLNLVYYRIWFLKLAPKLGLRRKPLWKTWIKTRL